MKKYLITGALTFIMGAFLSSCVDHDEIDYSSIGESKKAQFAENFEKFVGSIDANQDWGFGSTATARTRSQAAPVCAGITAPYDETWVATYNQTAKEPNSENVADNFDNSTYATNTGEGGPNYIDWNDPDQVKDRNYFFGDDGNQDSWETRLAWALANHPTWVTYTPDETFVRNFKITGTWNGGISVAATEGLTDGVANGNERTIVVTGTWNITENQRIGSLGKIIVAKGGTINISEGVQLEMVNESRLIVMSGGTVTGDGYIQVSNGNAAGSENYNGGEISVAKFNNNFGKFYNYGKFLVTEYQGGAKESNFYNHSLVSIKHTGLGNETPNARIFNACQWYCEGDMRCRNYEGISGSAFIVGGQLMVSGSEDGTSTPSYFSLAAGALVEAGSLYNNSTSWTGPTSGGYAVLSIGQFDHMNWVQDAPQDGGYFINNLYLVADDLTNIPAGNGYQAGETATAKYKFENIVANAGGNGNTKIVKKGSTEVIPADDDFVLGQSGCTPGFKIDEDDDDDDDDDDDNSDADIRVIAEDLTITANSKTNTDFDFNDVVFDVTWISDNEAKITLQAAGGTLPLTVGLDNPDDYNYADYEVHGKFGVAVNVMVNTNWPNGASKDPVTYTVSGNYNRNAKNIPVYVKKAGEWIELQANQGQPASKIGVSTSYNWCNEREAISSRYPNFSSWVTDGNPVIWW